MIKYDPHKNIVEITHFFTKINLIQINIIPKFNLIFIHKIIFNQMMKNTIPQMINNFTSTKDLVLTVLKNQIFFNHTHGMNNYDNLEIAQHHITIIFNNKIQSRHNHTNQLKCKTKSHCHIIHNITKKQKAN